MEASHSAKTFEFGNRGVQTTINFQRETPGEAVGMTNDELFQGDT